MENAASQLEVSKLGLRHPVSNHMVTEDTRTTNPKTRSRNDHRFRRMRDCTPSFGIDLSICRS